MIIDNRYEVIKDIGQGGMGIVLLVQDKATQTKYALKKISKEHTVSNALERFKREIASMTSLKHKNIVSIIDYKFGPDEYYIVQEYVNGENLEKIIMRRGKLSIQEAIDYMIQICESLNFIHQKNIFHKDLKPANILISNSGTIKLCDFGLSQSFDTDQSLTIEGRVAGSRHYMAPERYNRQTSRITSEIFAAGVIFYEMLTGQKPFNTTLSDEEGGATEIRNNIQFQPLPSMRSDSNINQALENVIIKATAKRPIERHQDFKELIEDLKTVFHTNREEENKLIVTQKYRSSFEGIIEDKTIYKTQINVPKHVIIFVLVFLTFLVGVFIYVS